MQHSFYSEAVVIQDLCIIYCIIWFPTMVLQKHPHSQKSVRIKENAMQSYCVDHRSILYITYRRY